MFSEAEIKLDHPPAQFIKQRCFRAKRHDEVTVSIRRHAPTSYECITPCRSDAKDVVDCINFTVTIHRNYYNICAVI
jgi:hypothetical protein